VTLVALLVYFAVTPSFAAAMGRGDQIQREWLTDPARGWSELARTASQIRSDASLMQKLETESAAEARRLAEQEPE
jgi:hypothetical protein